MVDSQAMLERLRRLRDYLALLRRISAEGAGAYLADPLLRGAGERYLQLSIEILLDLGSHIIAARDLAAPDTYADVFHILAEAGLLPDAVHRQVEGMAGFRNLLVHDYLRLDPERVFALLVEKLPVLEDLARLYEGIAEAD